MNLEELKQEFTEALPEIQATLKRKLIRRGIPDCGAISHEDLIQEACLKIWEDVLQFGKFHIAWATRAGWFGITNLLMKEARKRKLMTAKDPADVEKITKPATPEIEDLILTWISIARAPLTDRQAMAFKLRTGGFTLAEIAKVIKSTPDGSHRSIYIAKQKIRRQLM